MIRKKSRNNTQTSTLVSPGPGHQAYLTTGQMQMWRSRLRTLFVIVLAVFFALSTVCVASPADRFDRSANDVPGGCHGPKAPMHRPLPAHTCCFAAHQVTALISIVSSGVALETMPSDVIDTPPRRESPTGISAPHSIINMSPPLAGLLRI